MLTFYVESHGNIHLNLTFLLLGSFHNAYFFIGVINDYPFLRNRKN